MAQNRVYLSVASNIQPEANILRAMTELKPFCQLKAVSRCFVTDAIPAPGQPPTKDLPYYINCVVLVETEYEATSFKFDVLRSLETKLGRVRTADKYAPRTLDLDILLFNDAVIQAENVVIPDPDIKKRWFLAQGILDITPDLSLPDDVQPLQVYLQPLLDNLAATNQTFTEDQTLREKILAIA
ncbi:2-amino-4-hydroxy-6-hydroxymethyldihydropteridine diphosphokinase [Picosynechococcus sp. PCC 7003]|uniref:2-amino-4-hydroxy-6- hydroxymethyldihydropteridine diphosphokinase n=1 Tax=Picosynechococcus sp. PCC 7003 TaxID=374981 RepID=UPI0008106233|nr:2-amino-4-hydroxy-6-hydroxymethyldihydropteridine diphosphokinase [Picosynechococcus sp. PCC 7003]ANV83189.1 2-amino-4-hydroxy-6-hydroxymethyldihydropteridine diphosphokinase [Picosynechococcus sp. PCC 7003]